MEGHIDDWLTGLPDQLLVIILSSLPLREAARTSVLSSRWTNLWRHSLCLNFEAGDAAIKIAQSLRTSKYTDWVNSVLRSHKAHTLEEFRISCFGLDESNREAITTWLEFAFARRVQRLELNLVKRISATAVLIIQKCQFRAEHLRHFEVKSLKALCLRGVKVAGGDIEFFLHNFPFLEELIIQGYYEMPSYIELCGSSLALKHLEIISHCISNTFVKISAPKLTSLIVDTLWGLSLENVPMLVEFDLRCPLVHLTLDLNTLYKVPKLRKFPETTKLNKLVINFKAWDDKTLMEVTSFIKASPHLQEFEMSRLILSRTARSRELYYRHSPHHHLKVFTFSGYCGQSNDVELVRYIWMNCMALKKIIIDPRCPELCSAHSPRPQDVDWEPAARSYAKQQLEQHVPHHIQLLIL
ncbi:hypothetical protein ACS0TY_015512 [Phlomoides rotata]